VTQRLEGWKCWFGVSDTSSNKFFGSTKSGPITYIVQGELALSCIDGHQ
jgi:hypothetical protein